MKRFILDSLVPALVAAASLAGTGLHAQNSFKVKTQEERLEYNPMIFGAFLEHFDNRVRDFCHEAGVPIYATDEIFRSDIQVNHVRKDDLYAFDIELPKGNITVHVLPGHQDAVQNNIWIVTLPNGKVIGATGDQWRSAGEDLEWMKDIHSRLPRIDVLSIDCWIHDFDEHVADFNPRLVVSQHENEIGGHGIDHREAYWMTMFKNRAVHQSPVPRLLMTWGEWYDYK